MIVGWIFPNRERCGIAIYSRHYINALEKLCTVKIVDSDSWLNDSVKYQQLLNNCDIVHIQYETSFFSQRHHNYYLDIIKRLKKPVIVSLHEIYRNFPGVFPREEITGGVIISTLKKWYYDYRHPIQTAYRKHLSASFGASTILVHHRYQKEILANQIQVKCPIIVHSMPIHEIQPINETINLSQKSIVIGTTGFINPEFDYELLFKTLEQLKMDWQFMWVGGIRTPEHQSLLDTINEWIGKRNWTGKFIITGWVSEESQSNFLAEIDIYVALFKNRSSSASIARAIGAHRLIIATDCQIVQEINDTFNNNVIHIVKNDCHEIVNTITSILEDSQLIKMQQLAINRYISASNFNTMAETLIEIYNSTNKSFLQFF
jgi:glycosyltransferase involved in cell wall biosynthesis